VNLEPALRAQDALGGHLVQGHVHGVGEVVGTEPDPDHVHLGMKVRLTTFPIGTDSEGTEAIGFGFEPVEKS
jgi:riboflavin synthase alpha subunit